MREISLEPGSTISHFRLEKKLGEGGMGAVYLAEDLTLSRRIAIKFMSRAEIGQQASPEVVANLEQRFIREARSAASINHPNVAQIYEANFETETWFIAMELIHGKSLSELLESGRSFSITEAVQMLVQAIGGLKFAWDHFKIVHRDIKPQNLMLTGDGQVKIVDLGLAKPVASAEADYDIPELTGAGVPVGTPQYMAPEQAAGDANIDHRADIFALGATLYEVLTGEKAFQGKTAPMIYIAQMKKEYKPLTEKRTDAPAELGLLLDRMLEPNAGNRIGSYDELLHDLHQLCASLNIVGQGSTQFVTSSGTIPLGKSRSTREDLETYPTETTILNRYRVIQHLGRSRAGIVYLCVDTETKRDCAVKSLRPGREFPSESMQRIQDSYLRLKEMTHPNLVRIFDVHLNAENGELLVVMELLKGQNLRQYTHHEVSRHGSLDVKQIAPVLRLVAEALDSVAERFGNGHGDVKPESVYLVEENTRVKLLDYGITDEGSGRPIVSSGSVRIPLASPDYMAPELWRGEPLTPACDQYSLGVVAYEMLTRKLPFWLKDESSGTTTMLNMTELGNEQNLLKNMNRRVLSQPPPVVEHLAEQEQAALRRSLAKQPGERFSDNRAFTAALCGECTAPDKKRSPVLVVLGIAAIVLLAAIAAFFLLKDRDEGSEDSTGGGAKTTEELTGMAGLQAERGGEIDKLRLSLEEQLAILDTLPESANVALGDELELLHQRANAAVEAGDWAAAVTHFRGALSTSEQVVAQARELAQASAERRERLRQQAADIRAELQARLAALATQEQVKSLAGYEELLRRHDQAEAAWKEENHERAVTSYRQTLELLERVEEQARNLAAEENSRRQALLAKMKEEAVRLEGSVKQQVAVLGEKRHAAELPHLQQIRELSERAAVAVEKDAYAEAVNLLKKALDASHNAENEAQRLAREEAESLRGEADTVLKAVAPFAGLDPSIDELRVKSDVALALARDAMNRENFDFAAEQYRQIAEIGEGIRTIAKRFQAEAGQNFTVPRIGIELVWLEDARLWAGRYEVTNGQYRKYKPTHSSKKTEDGFTLDGDDQPVCWISYFDAMAYCAWLNATLRQSDNLPPGYEFRLPTAEEWKSMARCGKERMYPWGNEWPPKFGNFGNQEMFPTTWKLDGHQDEYPATCDVARSGENEWGLVGMAGNVWEWTSDEKDGGRAVYGGSWSDVYRTVLVIEIKGHNYADPSDSYDNIGFRLLLAPVTTAD